MFHLKKIDTYIFKRFFTLFLMTFLICIFILLMQFLWKHVAELVGKGISWTVLGEFFAYSILALVPMALPLAILLASLMTFGNLGENFELTAMKAAGISLFRIMRPLIIFISLVCVGAFYFSNNVLPVSQKKLWTLIFSMREKSPEFDIPVGEFYTLKSNSMDEGINIYVREKEKHVLKNLMIYDFSGGFENANVMVSDSGRIQFTADNKYLLLSLYDGERFTNLNKQRINNSANSIPYRRESFKTETILLDFNTQFSRLSDNTLNDQHVSKNFRQLTQSIDSVSKIADSKSGSQAKDLVSHHFLGREELRGQPINDSLKNNKKLLNADSLFLSLNQQSMVHASQTALDRAKSMKDLIEVNRMTLNESVGYILRHEIERHRRFTLSFACLIFFFIGAPLGAIIRKGGLGAPVVISVIMFIVYYIIDNTGYKMARESIWPTYEGMWLSSAILLPIGIFITYKAVIDATLFNPEQYIRTWNLIKRKINSIITKKTN